MRKERKHYTAEEKVAILRRHLLDKVPVSDLREELGLQPTVFYRLAKRLVTAVAIGPIPPQSVWTANIQLPGDSLDLIARAVLSKS